jgi:2-amino-4-hydroxy-6-hydroxymethyldihydropteridine diphosphokinase
MIVIGLGTNVGDRLTNLREAVRFIDQSVGKIARCSEVWETEPWGYNSPNSFYNAVCVVRYERPDQIFSLMEQLLRIEQMMGRMRNETNTYEDRIIDLDLISFDDLVLQLDNIIIPHPKMHLRKFVLLPLEQIYPSWYHPVLEKTVRELISECPDKTVVRKTDYKLL